MANYRRVARQAARKYGVPEKAFEAQINAESGFNANARSPAGASGIAQIIPATAKAWGVDANNPTQALDAAAKNMGQYIKKYGGLENALRAYNAGPGAIQKSKGYAETNNYVAKILGASGASGKAGLGAAAAPSRKGGPSRTVTTPGTSSSEQVPTFDQAGYEGAQRKSLLAGLISRNNPQSTLLKLGLLSTAAPDRGSFASSKTVTTRTPGSTRTIPGTSKKDAGGGGGARGGAAAAVSFASSRVGGYSETSGSNRGPQLDKLQKRFGFTGAPWCAIFTSVAASRGGMPSSGRTASVAAVRQQAQSGGGGYQKGFHNNDPRPGDLILFANDHIGMVEAVSGGKITTVEGNTSSGKVARNTRSKGSGDIVRPKYSK